MTGTAPRFVEQLVSDLSHPDAFPWRPGSVEVIETHISWVFLAGEFVVKVKRPVRFGFVDHGTAELRRASCEEEVRLNRRLTTGVYLDVVPIMRESSGHTVEGIGRPVEWATLMRRLPAGGMLDHLLTSGGATLDIADRIADRLIPFHTMTAADCGGSPDGSGAAVTSVVLDNLDELRPFAGTQLGARMLARVDAAMRTFVAEHHGLFASRAASGWVRDGHGDLRCEHVCLDGDDVQIFDCIEFSPAIRCVDVASDLAFLLMDLDRLGAQEIGRRLLERYRSGGVDVPSGLLAFYSAHRALVRAKVACLTHPDLHPEAESALRRDAVHFLERATRHVLTRRPALIVLSGLSGSGKSTAAQAIARLTGGTVMASDVVRKELAGVQGPAPSAWQQGLYDPAWSERTYDRLFALARACVHGGEIAVLDAAFLSDAQRSGAAQLARDAHVPMLLVEVTCNEVVTRQRLSARAAEGASPSDADWEVHLRQRSAWEAHRPVVPAGVQLVTVDSSNDDPDWLEPVLIALQEKGAIDPGIA